MSRTEIQRTSVSALLGAPVSDASGRLLGRVREFAVRPQEDATRVLAVVIGGRGQKARMVRVASLARSPAGVLRMVGAAATGELASEDYLMLERDLLDQQIIDVHGHKIVRVNDVDLVWEQAADAALVLRIAEVEVGVRGAIRRLLKGLPVAAVDQLACRVRASVIPWEFVDLIDRDPSRRVRLKIEQERLSKMHPSDLADILEELAPAEGQALFQSLDEEVAAEALEEVEPKTQKKLIESLDSERVAGIMEEMDPGAAADLLSSLSEERSDAILEEMGEKERLEVEELLDYAPDSAAGLMTTEFVAVGAQDTVADAIAALVAFEGDSAAVTDLLVLDEAGRLTGVIALSKLLLTTGETPLSKLDEGHMVSSTLETGGRKVAELFDKYNLRCLPIVDAHRQPAGVIQAEHVIAWLRNNP